jgi:3-deoxy-manno-octulosonate cytidylyltransferase (CMP-KDO synthetase)
LLEAIGIIPARYASVRFPGKALADLRGKPLVEHVYRRSQQAKGLQRLLVATDDERILRVVRDFGGEAVLTSPDHATGTDRLAEVARKHPADLYVNIQGDEPLVDSRDIDALVACLRREPQVEMATLRRIIEEERDLHSPHVVKVVADASGRALYFSRAEIPHRRGSGEARAYRHLGLYGYRRELLLEIARTAPGELERIEGLEQLRVLEMGRRIRVLDAFGMSIGVDVPEDLERVRALLDDAVH